MNSSVLREHLAHFTRFGYTWKREIAGKGHPDLVHPPLRKLTYMRPSRRIRRVVFETGFDSEFGRETFTCDRAADVTNLPCNSEESLPKSMGVCVRCVFGAKYLAA